MSARIHNIGIELDVETDYGETIVTIPSNPGEEEAKCILADMCGEYGRAEDLLKKNPLLLREFTLALTAAANHLSMIQSDLGPIFRKLDRIIGEHEWP